MVPPQKSLHDITLIGPCKAEPEQLRCTDSEVIALEKKGYTVSERTRSTGKSAFLDAAEALGRLLRHAELTGNAELLAKASDAIQALLRGNTLMSGCTGHAERERTTGGLGPGRAKQ